MADLGKSSTLELRPQSKIVPNNAANDCQHDINSGKKIREAYI